MRIVHQNTCFSNFFQTKQAFAIKVIEPNPANIQTKIQLNANFSRKNEKDILGFSFIKVLADF